MLGLAWKQGEGEEQAGWFATTKGLIGGTQSVSICIFCGVIMSSVIIIRVIIKLTLEMCTSLTMR